MLISMMAGNTNIFFIPTKFWVGKYLYPLKVISLKTEGYDLKQKKP